MLYFRNPVEIRCTSRHRTEGYAPLKYYLSLELIKLPAIMYNCIKCVEIKCSPPLKENHRPMDIARLYKHIDIERLLYGTPLLSCLSRFRDVVPP
jgi:hypothetical protein